MCLNQAHLGSFQPFNVDHFHTYISGVFVVGVFPIWQLNRFYCHADVFFFRIKNQLRSGEVGRARAKPLGPLPELRGHLVDPHQADLLLNGADGAISAESRDEEPLDPNLHLHLGVLFICFVFFFFHFGGGRMFWAVMLYRLYLYISFHFWPLVSFAFSQALARTQTLHPTVTQNLECLLFFPSSPWSRDALIKTRDVSYFYTCSFTARCTT